MQKYELTLTSNYVKDWTLNDSLRELLQNGIDQEQTIKDNKLIVEYKNGVLNISNKSSILEKRSLLLGSSTKTSDKKTIGQFGEGYKIALLVLTRLNKQVTIYNYGAKEVWTAKFINSRRYGEKILTIFIDKKFPWAKVPNNNLTISIENISEEEFNLFKEKNIYFHKLRKEDLIETNKGQILLNKKYKGCIFINSLYVSSCPILKYGYNVKPEFLSIGRDRNLINSFDVQFLTSSMWSENPDNNLLKQLILDNVMDIKYILCNTNSLVKQKLSNKIYENFIFNYGETAIPVSTQEEKNIVEFNYPNNKPVIVNNIIKNLVEANGIYQKQRENFNKASLYPKDLYNLWKENYKDYLPYEGLQELNEIIELFSK